MSILRIRSLLHKVTYLIAFSYPGFAQNITNIIGRVLESGSGEPLPAAYVTLNDSITTITDAKGYFKAKLTCKQSYTVTVSYVGYETFKKSFSCRDTVITVKLKPKQITFNPVVITATRHEQRLEKVPVSIEVLSPQLIDQQPAVSLDNIVNTLSGVQVTMRQITIRGASGWAYGVGSRTLPVLDDLPLSPPEASDMRWFLFPEGLIDRVEILKGASSALYGSGAMDGIVHVTLKEPTQKPSGFINFFTYVYDNPPIEHWRWWQSPLGGYRLQAAASTTIKKTGVLAYGEYNHYNSYKKDEWARRQRYILSLQRRIKKIKLKLTGHYLQSTQQDFFFWKRLDSAYVPFPGSIVTSNIKQAIIDPRITYLHNGGVHKLMGRFFYTARDTEEHKQIIVEYQYKKKYEITDKAIFWLTSGTQIIKGFIDRAAFFAQPHTQLNIAYYAHGEQTIPLKNNRELRVFAGVRLEGYKVDSLPIILYPVFRTGGNLQLAKATYFRASLGQGVRFPSIAELFTFYRLGPIYVLPEPNLKPEKGWTAEVGLRQLLSLKENKIQGFIDIAGFWYEYEDLVEYRFGLQRVNNLPVLGFRPINISNALVYGVETSLGLQYNFPKGHTRLWGGYTYITPLNKNWTPTDRPQDKWLTFRFRHLVKANYEVKWRNITAGIKYQYQSPLLNVDDAFLIIVPDTKTLIDSFKLNFENVDAFVGYHIPKINLQVQLYVSNLLNKPIFFLPGNVWQPRTFWLKVKWSFGQW
ncbi:MAG: TonB-dependent receptor [Chlorobi bacterium]|nr:TonB-dependent receptor [Chlorobiota bacterium]